MDLALRRAGKPCACRICPTADWFRSDWAPSKVTTTVSNAATKPLLLLCITAMEYVRQYNPGYQEPNMVYRVGDGISINNLFGNNGSTNTEVVYCFVLIV